jgi:hypothetical protein
MRRLFFGGQQFPHTEAFFQITTEDNAAGGASCCSVQEGQR